MAPWPADVATPCRRSVRSAVAMVVAAVVAAGCGGGRPGPTGAPPVTQTAPTAASGPVTTSTSTSTSTSTTAAPTTTTIPLPPAGDGALPQTPAEPSAATPEFAGEMAVLWRAVQTGQASVALPVFFPEAAYLQLKALSDDGADWSERLVAHFHLDIAAANALLGPGAGAATFVGVQVPPSYARWIPPGYCHNRIGYWYDPGSRLVYEEAGVERSIGIASLISWRGYWYVVHLGSETPPAGRGVVDHPAVGVGSFGSPAGC